MSTLINISNHPSEKWSKEQKAKWSKIIDIPFPNVPADADEIEVMKIASELFGQVAKIMKEDKKIKDIMLQGEFMVCYILIKLFRFYDNIRIVIPTTERIVVETNNPDGTTSKTAIFKFVRWRTIS